MSVQRSPRDEKIKDWRHNRRPNRAWAAKSLHEVQVCRKCGHKNTARGVILTLTEGIKCGNCRWSINNLSKEFLAEIRSNLSN